MGVLLTYPERGAPRLNKRTDPHLRSATLADRSEPPVTHGGPVAIGLIGAGQFANGTLLPAMRGLPGLRYRGVATTSGLSCHHTRRKFGFQYSATDYRQILEDPEVSLVLILTRHGSHARFVAEALRAGKHAFVEKPLALNAEQLQQVEEACHEAGRARTVGEDSRSGSPLLMVGFNRRFSPTAQWLRKRFCHVDEPLAVHCTVNAGFVPADSWVHDPVQGGGRIVGEVCHFVDLIQYLTGSVPVRVYAETVSAAGYRPSDNVAVTIKLSSGALGSITYVAGGDRSHPRERVEVFGGGAVGLIDNFQAASFTRQGRKERMRHWQSADRGHRAEVEALVAAIRQDGPAPVAFEEYVAATLTTFAIEDSLRQGQPVFVDTQGQG